MSILSDEIREKSGSVNSSDPLVCFLYLLMRDKVTPGDVGEVLIDTTRPGTGESKFSNGWLAEYAKFVAEKLRNSDGDGNDDAIPKEWR